MTSTKPVSLAARRKTRPTVVPPAEPEAIEVAVTLVFEVDGKAVLAMRVPGAFPKPTPGTVAHLQVTLDSRAILQRLEPALGPQAPHIWTPEH